MQPKSQIKILVFYYFLLLLLLINTTINNAVGRRLVLINFFTHQSFQNLFCSAGTKISNKQWFKKIRYVFTVIVIVSKECKGIVPKYNSSYD